MSASGIFSVSAQVVLAKQLLLIRGPDAPTICEISGLRLDPLNYFEPDFIVYNRAVRLSDVKGPDVLLAVEVAQSSLNYDLNSKSRVYAAFGVKELWVIDAKRRIVHTLANGRSGVFADVDKRNAAFRLLPTCAPEAFTFALDDLEDP